MFRGWVLFLILLFLYALTFGGHLYSPDEELMFRTVESLARHASLAIEPIEGFATRKGIDDREYAQYGIGQPIVAVPFYYLGKALRPLASDAAWIDLGRRMRADYVTFAQNIPAAQLAQGMATRMAVSAFNLLITALSGLILFRLMRRLCGNARAAWLAALLWGAGSIAWAHSRTFFSEPFTGFCLLLALETLSRYFFPTAQPAELTSGSSPAADAVSSAAGDKQALACGCLHQCACGASGHGCWTLPLFTGIAAGYACLVRLDSVVFLPSLALLVIWGDFLPYGRGSKRAEDEPSLETNLPSALPTPDSRLRTITAHLFRGSTLRRLILFAIPLALAGAIILGLNTLHFGSPFASAYSDQPEGITFSTPILAGLYGFLMSVGKGMFFFSPALVLCFWGFGPMLRRRLIFGVAVIALFLSLLLFKSAWRNWAGGWCWGPRHIVQIHALLAIPIAFWLAQRWDAVRRIAVIIALIVGAAVQIYGSSQNFIEFYRIYYRDPAPPNAQPLYDLESSPELTFYYHAFFNPGNGQQPVEVPLTALPAPINDSIYIVQNSQWPRYAEMLRALKIHDLFWLHMAESR